MGLKSSGAGAVRGKLSKGAKATVQQVGSALYMEGQIELTEAKKRTPVWNPARKVPEGHTPGALRASGRVSGPTAQGTIVSIVIAFGGQAIAYARRVHEDLEAFHATGQAKYLESTVTESRPYMMKRVGKRINLDKAFS